jgi:hypothetical protein
MDLTVVSTQYFMNVIGISVQPFSGMDVCEVQAETRQTLSNVQRASVAFSLSSIAMILLNKGAASWFPHISLLLILQNSVTIIILILTSTENFQFDVAVSKKWAPCAVLFCMNLYSSLQSLIFISVSTFTVLRNTQPLLAVCMDFALRGKKTEAAGIVYLSEVLVGAVLYCAHDLGFNMRGYVWAAVHVLSMTCYSILVKRQCQTLCLSSPYMSYYNNILSIPGLLLIGWFEISYGLNGMHNSINDIMQCANSYCVFIVALSCIGGFCVSVSGFQAQQVMSPTSWLCLNNFSKIPAIIISYMVFGGHASGATMHGMTISICCAYFYSISNTKDTTRRMQFLGVCLASSCLVWIKI